MTQKKFHLVSINYAPEKIGIAVYSAGLAEYMARHGYDVTVFTSYPHYPEWQIAEGWKSRGYNVQQEEENLCLVRCPIYVPEKPTGKKRLMHYLSFAASVSPQLFWRSVKERPDVVFVVAPSLIAALPAWVFAKLTGSKFWVHVQDFEVEAAFATGVIPEQSKLGRIAKNFERWMFCKADRVSTISRPMIDKLREKGVNALKIRELRNWANLKKVSVVEGVSPLRDELEITTDYVAYYSGNIGAKQGLDIIPKAARLLADRSDLTFVICGDGAYLDSLKSQAEGLPNIRFLPLQPLEKLSDALGMADVHLLPQRPEVAELVLPSKLTNILASGRPVVATADEGTALAEEVEGCGLVCPTGDPSAFAGAIETLLDDAELRKTLGETARTKAIQRWDMNNILGEFEAEIGAMTAPDRSPKWIWTRGAQRIMRRIGHSE